MYLMSIIVMIDILSVIPGFAHRSNSFNCDFGAPHSRMDCGYGGISVQQCEERGCCYDDTQTGVNYCFFPNKNFVSSDFQVISATGDKLPIYTDIFYAIKNKDSGHYWAVNYDTVTVVDNRNTSHWHSLIKSDQHDYYMRQSYDNTLYATIIFVSANYLSVDKIDNTYYRLIHRVENEYSACSGLPFEESNRHIYCRSTNKFNAEMLWQFIEHPDYKINAKMNDFEYEMPLQTLLEQHIKTVDLLESSVITNDSPAKLTQEISKEIKKTQSFDITYSKSITQSSKFFAKYSIHASISGKIFGIGESADTTTEFGVELGRDVTTTTGSSKTVSNEVTYTIKKTVEVPPYEKVKLFSYVNWVENLSLPYKAKVTVTGSGPVFENNGQLDSDTLEILLRKYGFDEKLIDKTQNSLTFEVRGTITGSYGLDSVFSVTSLGHTRNTTYYTNIITKQSVAIDSGFINTY